MVNIGVRGTAHFEPLELKIPVPFESSKRIWIIDKIKARLDRHAATRITPDISESGVCQGDVVSIGGRLATDDGNALPDTAVQTKG